MHKPVSETETALNKEDWDSNSQAVISLYRYAGLTTAIYSAACLIFGIYYLALCIFCVCVIFYIMIMLFETNHRKPIAFLAFLNITVIAVSGTIFLGLNCGARYFLLCSTVLFMSNELMKNTMKCLLSILCLAEYIWLGAMFKGVPSFYPGDISAINIMNQLNLFTAFGAIVYSFRSYISAVVQYEQKLEELTTKANLLANYDQLTGLESRHAIYVKLDKLLSNTDDKSTCFVMAMADVDDFKKINDQYGHLCGDEVLKTISDSIKKTLRRNDMVGRWGGEEFLIVLPDTYLQEGLLILERVRRNISEEVLKFKGNRLNLTITIGCAEYKKDTQLTELIHQADEKMYSGKKSGRNTVVG